MIETSHGFRAHARCTSSDAHRQEAWSPFLGTPVEPANRRLSCATPAVCAPESCATDSTLPSYSRQSELSVRATPGRSPHELDQICDLCDLS